MRSARTMLATAAVAAAVLTAGAPAAFADGGTDKGPNLTWQEKQEKAASPEGQKAWEEKQAKGGPTEEKAPHGGVHTGGGGLALSGGGLASGAVLLLGGLGVGALALRRGRRTADAAL